MAIDGEKPTHGRKSICTISGQEVYPFTPDPEDIILADIAHALSLKVRYTGHTEWLYTVAQHSILMCRWANDLGLSEDVQLQCLMHDAAEAYLPDIASPLKSSIYVDVSNLPFLPDEDPLFRKMSMAPFKAVEESLLWVIFGRFQMNPHMDPMVKTLDTAIYLVERKVLLPDCDWWTPGDHDLPATAPPIIREKSEDLEEEFLDLAHGFGIG